MVMIRAVLVFGVVAAFAVADFGRISSFGLGRRGFQCYARGHACFKNASQESPVDRLTEYGIVRLLKNSWRNATMAAEKRQREMNQNGVAEVTERSPPLLFDFGFRRGGGRGGRRLCPENNQTIFFETLSDVRTSVLAEAPNVLANYNISAADPFFTQYFLCMEATRFDGNGTIIVA